MWLAPTKRDAVAMPGNRMSNLESTARAEADAVLDALGFQFPVESFLREDVCRAARAHRRDEDVWRRLIEGVRKTRAAVRTAAFEAESNQSSVALTQVCLADATQFTTWGGDTKKDFPFSHRSYSTLQKEVAKTH